MTLFPASAAILRRIVVPAWFAELMGGGAANDNWRLSE